MKKLLIVLLAFLLLFSAIYIKRREIQCWLFEKSLSTGTREFFEGPVRLKDGYIDKDFKMHLSEMKATLKNENGPAPLEIRDVTSQSPVFDYFSPQGTVLHFDGVKPQGSQSKGISGRAELKSEGGGHFKLDAKIEELDLSEIEWANPENLKGSKGAFTGSITSDGKFTENPQFKMILTSKDGLVQAKFFSVLLPYLPALPTKDKMAALSAKGAVVPFKDAAVRVEMTEPEKLKIFLHILIPDYNVALNINFEIRLEEAVTFSQLARTMGLIKVKA